MEKYQQNAGKTQAKNRQPHSLAQASAAMSLDSPQKILGWKT